MKINWKLCGRKLPGPNLSYCINICLEVLKKIVRDLCQDNQSLGQDFHPGPRLQHL
jgi:hypothetical protein